MKTAIGTCLFSVLLALVVPVAAQESPAPPAIDVRVDPRVELMSIVFRLAGNPEYRRARVPSYATDVDEHFGPLREHAVVEHARALHRERGVGYDAVMSLAVHLDASGNALQWLRPGGKRPVALDARWPDDEVGRFVDELAAFAEEGDFDRWFTAHEELYHLATKRMEAVLSELDRRWFDRFFGTGRPAPFHVALGLLNGGNCYGPRVVGEHGGEDFWCVLGTWQVDDEGRPDFDASMLPTVVHEFCHSYCNPIVAAHWAELAPGAEALFDGNADTMRSQAYGDAKIVMGETFVRASVVCYLQATQGAAAAQRELAQQASRGFAQVGELAECFADYEADRTTYPDLGAFVPRVAEWLGDYVERASEARRHAPAVVTMQPANGATDVAPDLTELRVTFDRPMRDGSWSFVGGGPSFPETTGPPSYDAGRTTIVLPVVLKPGHDYVLGLNSPSHQAFVSEDGVPLPPLRWNFRTRE